MLGRGGGLLRPLASSSSLLPRQLPTPRLPNTPSLLPSSLSQQSRQMGRWVNSETFNGGETKAWLWLNDGCVLEGIQRKWQGRQFNIKPYMARKIRYDRWVRRRSIAKINSLLDNVNYEKAKRKGANKELAAVWGLKDKKA